MTEPTLKMPASVIADDRLWAVFVRGPNDWFAAHDRANAQRWAAALTLWWARHAPEPHPFDPIVTYEVREWAGEKDNHRENLRQHGLELDDWMHRFMSGLETYQSRVSAWMAKCFGAQISADKVERCDRFIEEAIELVQSLGYTEDRIRTLTRYVFDRPAGEPMQEVGGVMVTLAALCEPNELDLCAAAEAELARVWTKIDAIRAKQAKKRDLHSALPE